MDSWSVPHIARPSLAGHRDNRGPNTPWEPSPDYLPTITFTDARDGGCLTVLDGQRCPYQRYHDGPCQVCVVGDTGLTYVVIYGQAGTSADPRRPTPPSEHLAAVLDLHEATDLGTGEDHAVQFCTECHQPAPCATRRIALGLPLDVDLTEGASA